ncbi:hypothetical protein [Streptomyces sp. NPDC002172]
MHVAVPVRAFAYGFPRAAAQDFANLCASSRAAEKIRRQKRGHEYAAAQLVRLGAPVPRAGGDPALWLRDALLAVGAQNVGHSGPHRYVFRLGRNRREREGIRLGLDRHPYPKRPDPARP